MKTKIKFSLFTTIGALFIISACSSSVDDTKANLNSGKARAEASYDLVLSFNNSKKVGTIRNGRVTISDISLPNEFTFESETYEIEELSSIGAINSKDLSNIYLTLKARNVSTEHSLLFATSIDVIDLNGVVLFGPACPSYSHSCADVDCNACEFNINDTGCIAGCICLDLVQVEGQCNHTVSTGGSSGWSMIDALSAFVEDGSSNY